jgi:hypothetical protein
VEKKKDERAWGGIEDGAVRRPLLKKSKRFTEMLHPPMMKESPAQNKEK